VKELFKTPRDLKRLGKLPGQKIKNFKADHKLRK